MKDLNNKLYSNQLLDEWVNREKLIPAEEYLLGKYLKETAKNVIEAGTGGGRISFYIEEMGFETIYAFDYVPEMIIKAKEKSEKKKSTIDFFVADATDLSDLPNEEYDYLIYLQQILCFIEEEKQFQKALNEAYRIAKKDSITLFSFLDYDSRLVNIPLRIIVSILRKIRKEKISGEYLPWLKIGNTFNWKLFSKDQALTYWVKREKIIMELTQTGYKIVEVKNANQINNPTERQKGMLYIVCRK